MHKTICTHYGVLSSKVGFICRDLLMLSYYIYRCCSNLEQAKLAVNR